MSGAPKGKQDFSAPVRFPFLIGVYMGTNAIPDAYTIVDGPDCLFFKAEYIHGKHDGQSTLLDVFGNHRIALTNVNAGNVAKSQGEAVRRKILKLDRLPGANVVFISSLPMVTIIGTQYDTIIREVQSQTRVRLIDCPNRSLQGDWLMGYSDLLTALASNIDVAGSSPDPRKVAVIGNLMDRTEFDHRANVAELERLVGALDLELTSVWLGGQPFAKLCEAKDAGTLVAFPLGRKAARALAKRTGAKVVEVDAPFGPGRTRRFLAALAKETGRKAQAERFVDAELKRLVPRLEWVVPHVFTGKKAGFMGAPDLLGGFVELAEELGLEVSLLVSPASKLHLAEDLEKRFPDAAPALFEPKWDAVHKEFDRLRERGGLDLVVCNDEMHDMMRHLGPAHVPFGFPTNFSHALCERPFLGFTGWIDFVDRMANALTARRPQQQPYPAQAPEMHAPAV